MPLFTMCNNDDLCMQKNVHQYILFLSALGVTGVVLLLDILIPLGYIEWIFFVIPFLIIYQTENSAFIILLLIVDIIALIIGYIFSPPPPHMEDIRTISITNRIIGFSVLTLFTLIINSLIQKRKYFKYLSERLQFSNKELESFSYSAAHDLRSPLSTIKGYSQTILEIYETTLDKTALDCLRGIIRSTEKMSELIDDMLSLSNITLQDISLQDIDLSALAQSVADNLSLRAPDRDAEIWIQSNLKTRADPHLMEIVLTNLLQNAWKYTSKKEKTKIAFGLTQKNGQDTYYIKDNGAGFDMKHAEKLFTPFRRLHPEGQFPGTGIGLSIVERIIRKHGGRVWGEGETDKGAVFYFTLPRNPLF